MTFDVMKHHYGFRMHITLSSPNTMSALCGKWVDTELCSRDRNHTAEELEAARDDFKGYKLCRGCLRQMHARALLKGGDDE